MQSYLVPKNTDNKLIEKIIYTLKNKRIKYKLEDDLLVLELDLLKQQIVLRIFHDNYIPSFILCEEENINLANEIDKINLLIEDYERIEDIIYDLLKIANRIKMIKKIDNKNHEKFKKDLEIKKDAYIKKYKEEKMNNSSIFSLRESIEMLGDQIIKIYDNDNFFVSIKDFPNIKVYMKNFTFKNAEELEIKILIKVKSDLVKEPPIIDIKSNKELEDNLLKVIQELKPFKQNNWSVKYSLYDTLVSIHSMISTFGKISSSSTNTNGCEEILEELEYLLNLKTSSVSITKLLEIFDKDLINSNNINYNNNNYWKKGTGYGHSGVNSWNIDEYINTLDNKKRTITSKMAYLLLRILKDNTKLDDYIEKLNKIFILYFEHIETNESINNLNNYNVNIFSIETFINKNDKYYINNADNPDVIKLVSSFRNYGELHDKSFKLNFLEQVPFKINEELIHKELDSFQQKFIGQEIIYYNNKFNSFHDFNQKNIDIDTEKLYRLRKEFNIIKKSISNNKDASVFFRIEKDNISKMKFMISGPINTPYAYGLYIFDMTIPNTFPNTPPLVNFRNNGGKRFNPNLYKCGKVCLSLLGTWSGDKGEKWNAVTSTFFQIIISIQSLILVEEPYFNEPGHERFINQAIGKEKSEKYNEETRLFNLDHTINDLIEQILNNKNYFDEYYDVIRKYFIFQREDMIKTFTAWEAEYKTADLKIQFSKSLQKFIEISKLL
jgi:ubiquitin-protein ligase